MSVYSHINTGCPGLLKRIQKIGHVLSVFGHLHEEYGYVKKGNTFLL